MLTRNDLVDRQRSNTFTGFGLILPLLCGRVLTCPAQPKGPVSHHPRRALVRDADHQGGRSTLDGYVTDSSTAVAIARAICAGRFGKSSTDDKHFTATLSKGIWDVRKSKNPAADEMSVRISQKTGAILEARLGPMLP